jgi:hypothetical protein
MAHPLMIWIFWNYLSQVLVLSFMGHEGLQITMINGYTLCYA